MSNEPLFQSLEFLVGGHLDLDLGEQFQDLEISYSLSFTSKT